MTQIPVFIGGFRSGTTLLINLLAMHPDIAAWFETKSLCEVLRWLKVIKNPELASIEAERTVPREPGGFTLDIIKQRMQWHVRYTAARISGEQGSGKAAHEKYPLGFDCIAYSLDQALKSLDTWSNAIPAVEDYHSISKATGQLIRGLSEQQMKGLERSFWINKTPEISRFAPELRDCLGQCKIIYMVRNGIDVVSSAKKLGWAELETLSYNWRGLIEQTRIAMQDYPEHYLELRYEELVKNPEEVLDKVLSFTGIEPHGEKIVAGFKQDFGPKAFDQSRISSHSLLGSADLDIFKKIAGDLQAELGY